MGSLKHLLLLPINQQISGFVLGSNASMKTLTNSQITSPRQPIFAFVSSTTKIAINSVQQTTKAAVLLN